MKGINVMYGYKGKVIGMFIAGITLVILLIQKFTGFTVIDSLSPDRHFNILLWITLFGLVMVMFSKEKNEDERVQYIRYRSVMTVFLMMISATLGFAFTVSILPDEAFMEPGTSVTGEDMVFVGRLLMYYPAVAIVLYLVMFHIGLYFDEAWDYEDKAWSWRQLWKNKRYRLLFLVVSLLIIELIFRLIE